MSAPRLRAARHRRPEGVEAGFTVIELMVGSLIMLIVTFICFSFLDSATSAEAKASFEHRTEASLLLTLRRMSEDVRAAEPIATTYPTTGACPAGGSYPTGYATCLSFTVPGTVSANSPSCPYSVITYGLKSGSVLEDRDDYNSSCTLVRSTRGLALLTDVVNGATPLFTYYDKTGSPITLATATASQVAASGSVQMTLAAQYLSTQPAMTLSEIAALRNNR